MGQWHRAFMPLTTEEWHFHQLSSSFTEIHFHRKWMKCNFLDNSTQCTFPKIALRAFLLSGNELNFLRTWSPWHSMKVKSTFGESDGKSIPLFYVSIIRKIPASNEANVTDCLCQSSTRESNPAHAVQKQLLYHLGHTCRHHIYS